jgi:hypothetical protein
VTTAHSGILGYQALAAPYLKKMPALRKIQEITKSEALSFLYQRACRRIDIEFYAEDSDTSPVNLKTCFEHGAPYGVRKKEYLQDLRNL